MMFPQLDSIKDSKEIKKTARKLSNLEVRVTGIVNIRDESIANRTATVEEQNKILNALTLENSNMLSARLSPKRQLRVIFFNVPRKLSNESFLCSTIIFKDKTIVVNVAFLWYKILIQHISVSEYTNKLEHEHNARFSKC